MGFSAEQQRTLSALLDEIIPGSADCALPGAGELGLAAYVEQVLDGAPGLRPLIARGLAQADERARGDFASLPPADRRGVLGELESALPGFLPSLVFHTYVAYYQDPRVRRALGLEARPPHPLGYEMEPNDLSLLDPVQARPKLYREP